MNKIYLGAHIDPNDWCTAPARGRLTLTENTKTGFVASAIVVEARTTTNEQANKLFITQARIGGFFISAADPFPWETFLEGSPVFARAMIDPLTAGAEISIEFDNQGDDPIELRAWLAGEST